MVVMKRIMGILLFIVLLPGLFACGSTAKSDVAAKTQVVESAGAEETHAAVKSKILVVYFSRTGNTRFLAEQAAELLRAELYEITPEVPYTESDINYNDASSRATIEQKDEKARPAISGRVENMEAYDTIVLAYPIWWGQAPRIMSSFMESYDFSGKTIVPFCTSHSSGIGSSAENLRALGADSAKWFGGKRFAAGASATELQTWFREIKMAN